MKVYLASTFRLVDKVERIAETLREHGFEITQEWWHKDYKKLDLPEEEWYLHPDVLAISRKNFEAIDRADMLVFVADGGQPRKFNGANVELGYAIAKGKKCCSIGKLERSAMYCPVHQFSDVDSFLIHNMEE